MNNFFLAQEENNFFLAQEEVIIAIELNLIISPDHLNSAGTG